MGFSRSELVSRRLFGALTLLVSCGGASIGCDPASDAALLEDAGAAVEPGSLPCEVEAVLAKNCRSCHASTPQFGAPMPLVTYADLHAPLTSDPSKRVFQQVPLMIDRGAMPPSPNAPLTSAERATLDDWAAAGAPPGPETCGASGFPDAGSDRATIPTCTPDIEIVPSASWEMPSSTTDEYVCFGVDVPVTSKRHAIAVVPKIDNTKIVHHVLLMQADQTVSPAPTPCSAALFRYRILYGWAPGAQGLELPPSAGLPLEGTTHYVVQVHYSNVNRLAGEKDRSGFGLCTTPELRPHDADVLAFGSHRFTIQPRQKLDLTCDFKVPSGLPTLTAFAAMPHMHQLGKAISTVNLPGGGGAPIDLGTSAEFQFSTQSWYAVRGAVTSGDTIRTRCVWENPTGSPVSWGESTREEMCYSFTLYYPKITVSPWSWAAPAQASSCKPTP